MRDANRRVSNLQEVTGQKALLTGLLNDKVRCRGDSSRHATLVVLPMSRPFWALFPKQVANCLFHHIAANFGNGAGERDVLGADLDTVLGITTLLDAAIPH